jgi:hypothetical protein
VVAPVQLALILDAELTCSAESDAVGLHASVVPEVSHLRVFVGLSQTTVPAHVKPLIVKSCACAGVATNSITTVASWAPTAANPANARDILVMFIPDSSWG